MPKYRVSGTIELNFTVDVDAATPEAAEQDAKLYVEDGSCEYNDPVDDPEIHDV